MILSNPVKNKGAILLTQCPLNQRNLWGQTDQYKCGNILTRSAFSVVLSPNTKYVMFGMELSRNSRLYAQQTTNEALKMTSPRFQIPKKNDNSVSIFGSRGIPNIPKIWLHHRTSYRPWTVQRCRWWRNPSLKSPCHRCRRCRCPRSLETRSGCELGGVDPLVDPSARKTKEWIRHLRIPTSSNIFKIPQNSMICSSAEFLHDLTVAASLDRKLDRRLDGVSEERRSSFDGPASGGWVRLEMVGKWRFWRRDINHHKPIINN